MADNTESSGQVGRPPRGGRYARIERPPLLCDTRQCPVPDNAVGTRVRLPSFQKFGQIIAPVACGVCGYQFPQEWEPTRLPDDYSGT